MGIYIADRDKPKDCWRCCFAHDYDCILIRGSERMSIEEQYKKCPIVEIELPCGDGVSMEVK